MLYEDKLALARKAKIESETFQRIIEHLRNNPDVQNIDMMNLANFCRNCISKWYREEAIKMGQDISDPDARKEIYGMSYEEWKAKYPVSYTHLTLPTKRIV